MVTTKSSTLAGRDLMRDMDAGAADCALPCLFL